MPQNVCACDAATCGGASSVVSKFDLCAKKLNQSITATNLDFSVFAATRKRCSVSDVVLWFTTSRIVSQRQPTIEAPWCCGIGRLDFSLSALARALCAEQVTLTRSGSVTRRRIFSSPHRPHHGIPGCSGAIHRPSRLPAHHFTHSIQLLVGKGVPQLAPSTQGRAVAFTTGGTKPLGGWVSRQQTFAPKGVSKVDTTPPTPRCNAWCCHATPPSLFQRAARLYEALVKVRFAGICPADRVLCVLSKHSLIISPANVMFFCCKFQQTKPAWCCPGGEHHRRKQEI